jgi:hypothetical protein
VEFRSQCGEDIWAYLVPPISSPVHNPGSLFVSLHYVLDRIPESVPMKWLYGLRLVLVLRRIAVALEGIHEQLIYQNDRHFPPIHQKNGTRSRIVISRGKPDAPQEGS